MTAEQYLEKYDDLVELVIRDSSESALATLVREILKEERKIKGFYEA